MWWHFQPSMTALHHLVSLNDSVLHDFTQGSVEIEGVLMDWNASVRKYYKREKTARTGRCQTISDVILDPPTKKSWVSSLEKPNCCSWSNLQILLRKYEHESIITYGASPIKYNKLLLLTLYTKQVFWMLTYILKRILVLSKRQMRGPLTFYR